MKFSSPTSLLPIAIYGILTAPRAAAKCSAGLVNIVFNGPAVGDKIGPGSHPDSQFFSWFSKMPAAKNWITFNEHEYEKKIPMLGDNEDAVLKAIKMVTSANPPEFLLTFNEPDWDYKTGKTKLTPQAAAELIEPLLNTTAKHTKFIAPVPAFQMSSWLPEFYEKCKCRDRFYAHSVHIYNHTINEAKTAINAFHSKYNDKPLWITEIAPRQPNCDAPTSSTWAKSTEFMNEIFAWGQQIEWIEKIFWNSGNQIVLHCDTNVAASYLIDGNGNPTPLLAPFNNLTCSHT